MLPEMDLANINKTAWLFDHENSGRKEPPNKTVQRYALYSII
jgi:hypothetical protein